MRILIAIALGLLLLVSAAAAQGNDNTAVVTVVDAISGNLATGANIAQLSDLDANLLGNDISAVQTEVASILDNNLVGAGNGKTNVIQIADLMINDTGNANSDLQTVDFIQGGNDLTIGNITQMGMQKVDDIGSNNIILQDSGALAGVFNTVGSPNLLINSELAQKSYLDVYMMGNTNDATQVTTQTALDNGLIDSKLYEQVAINANILGNENNLGTSQIVLQVADSDDLVNSWVNELVCLDEQITGNGNDVIQFAETSTFDNILTTSAELQSISATAKELGNGNLVNQNIGFENSDNNAVGSHLVQETDIETNS